MYIEHINKNIPLGNRPLTGTEGPGVGVDCVTVVMALLWVVTLVESAAEEEEAASALELPSPCVTSSLCWAAGEET